MSWSKPNLNPLDLKAVEPQQMVDFLLGQEYTQEETDSSDYFYLRKGCSSFLIPKDKNRESYYYSVEDVLRKIESVLGFDADQVLWSFIGPFQLYQKVWIQGKYAERYEGQVRTIVRPFCDPVYQYYVEFDEPKDLGDDAWAELMVHGVMVTGEYLNAFD